MNMCEWQKFQATETKRRWKKERCLTHNVDERDYQSDSSLFHWSQTAEDFGELSLCFQGGRGGRAIVWTGSKRSENGGAGIFTPRVCTGGLHAAFLCHLFDSIISWMFWRLALISWVEPAFNAALSL